MSLSSTHYFRFKPSTGYKMNHQERVQPADCDTTEPVEVALTGTLRDFESIFVGPDKKLV